MSKLSVLMRVSCSDAVNLMNNIVETGLLLLSLRDFDTLMYCGWKI